ncbi:MAG: aminomethyl-transferring glycine dehydrogenase [Calditrichaceae bacterium]|nr:aminomethyl-transferring glycine dehydrogenase [Calditrichaceae bacterium]
MNHTEYQHRHIGPRPHELDKMLETIKVKSLDELVEQTVPKGIRLSEYSALPESLPEHEFLMQLKKTASKNKIYKSYIGLGYYECIVPSVIKRNIFENPGWYTQYTPYQAEISQGRLEALLNFQTMIMDLTGMEVANASLLDEGTAAAEAMTMLYRVRSRDKQKAGADKFFISKTVFQHTIDVLQTRAEPLGIELVIGEANADKPDDSFYGALLQNPAEDGSVSDLTEYIAAAHSKDILVAVCADLLSLVLIKSPGSMGADVVVGSSQRFGVPMGYGGPHAAFFATREDFKRQMPGRIIGVSVDRYGNKAYRMALQTREQHIRREKATSNICTAQALLAIMSGMYAVYHGPKGLKQIAGRVHSLACMLSEQLKNAGVVQVNQHFFDTLKIEVTPLLQSKILEEALKSEINFRKIGETGIGISIDEATCESDILEIIKVVQKVMNPEKKVTVLKLADNKAIPAAFIRTDEILNHPVFNSYHSETGMVRYIKKLENRDLSLTASMIPLGSCTMKLNPATAMYPVSWPEFASLHPFVSMDQAVGYHEIICELEELLANVTGLAATSLQPNSGAQGEYTGLMVIRAYHKNRGEDQRNVVLIPSSAHGTNPASAAMAGSEVVIIKCDDHGNIDIPDLRDKAALYKERLSAIMVTYPSTHGVFEEGISEICKIIHENGGQVYMDGANMNAQVGLTNPGVIGADVCHLNLHKTFSIPHGGGGPGVGPICAAKHLAPFLPGHRYVKTGGEKAISAVASAPWGSANVLLISYAYLKMLGLAGSVEATRYAILNANYIKSRLEKYYPVLYTGAKGRVAHELIFDLRGFHESAGIDAEDIAKRLMDYGIHAPTMSWPVAGTIMVEPTESEPLEELDRFCEAMIAIHKEIKDIETGKADKENNVLKNAPHTAVETAGDAWNHPYSREQAVFPLGSLKENKFWPYVGRIDNTYGDRNLVCACPPIESYTE